MKKWRKKQVDDAKDFGGKETPRSGGFWSFAGDVKTDQFLIESKTTDKKSYSIKSSTWKKVEHEALKSSRTPMMSICLINDATELVVLDKNDFIEILKRGEKDESKS